MSSFLVDQVLSEWCRLGYWCLCCLNTESHMESDRESDTESETESYSGGHFEREEKTNRFEIS